MDIAHTTDAGFRVEASMDPLLERLEEVATGATGVAARTARELADRVEAFKRRIDAEPLQNFASCPEAVALFSDLATHFMGAEAAEAPWAFMVPFRREYLAVTPAFLAIKQKGAFPAELQQSFHSIGSFADFFFIKTASAILSRSYGLPIRDLPPLVLEVKDPETGDERTWEMELLRDFSRVVASGGLPILSEADRVRLAEGMDDAALVASILPPSNFKIEGMVFGRFRDITAHRLSDELRRVLTRSSSLNAEGLEKAGAIISRILGREGVAVSLAAPLGDEIIIFHSGAARCEYGCMTRKRRAVSEGSRMDLCMREGRPMAVWDLAAAPLTEMETELAQAGVRAMLLLPLEGPGGKPSLLTLTSDAPGTFALMDSLALEEVLPDISIALTRSMERLEHDVRDFIQTRYTAIHPSVEWRFREEAMDHLLSGKDDVDSGAKISFDSVWPLYAVSDVRGSSTIRAEAIRADLERQLLLAREAVAAASADRPLPVLAEGAFRIDAHLASLRGGITSGQEVELLAFIRRELEPLMDGLAPDSGASSSALEKYRAGIDPAHGTVYERRRDFDESIERMNRAIAAYLDREQSAAQAMYPHYFDRSSTDGVDMSMYIGPGMARGREWRPLWLRNLRLWQLMAACGIARLCARLGKDLPIPLAMTHLIVVQDMPIGVRFSEDEKRFVVDGAYNIRYEILKKRIDKAVVAGTGERLTQPDQIAIVYTHAAERIEYESFLEFLESARLITGGVEHLELEDLQGISGLKALRARVDLDSAAGPEDGIIERITRAAIGRA